MTERRDIAVSCHRLLREDWESHRDLSRPVPLTHAVEVNGQLRCAHCLDPVPSR